MLIMRLAFMNAFMPCVRVCVRPTTLCPSMWHQRGAHAKGHEACGPACCHMPCLPQVFYCEPCPLVLRAWLVSGTVYP